jgi:hypothetical protein
MWTTLKDSHPDFHFHAKIGNGNYNEEHQRASSICNTFSKEPNTKTTQPKRALPEGLIISSRCWDEIMAFL